MTTCLRVASLSVTSFVSEVAAVPTDTLEVETESDVQVNVDDWVAVGAPLSTARAEIAGACGGAAYVAV